MQNQINLSSYIVHVIQSEELFFFIYTLICVFSKVIKNSGSRLLCWKACCEHVSSLEGDYAESLQNTAHSSTL